MNGAHLHLAISHIPVVGTGIALLVFLIGSFKRKDEITKIGFLLFILIAISAVPTFFSGEAAEEIVERMPGMLEPLIEQHEKAAKISMTAVIGAGILAFVGTVFFLVGKSPPRWLRILFLFTAIATGILLARTANIGGQIGHEEIRSSTPANVYENEKGDQ